MMLCKRRHADTPIRLDGAAEMPQISEGVESDPVGLREWVRYVIMERFFTSQRKSDVSAATVAEAETNHKARSSTPRLHHRNAHRNN
jgi:hypothetical protein